jgi:phosphotransferase system  glucose/maltose/N-acetylglucosamine-specific IIC component
MLGHGATVAGTLGVIVSGIEYFDRILHPLLPLLSAAALLLGIAVHIKDLRKK